MATLLLPNKNMGSVSFDVAVSPLGIVWGSGEKLLPFEVCLAHTGPLNLRHGITPFSATVLDCHRFPFQPLTIQSLALSVYLFVFTLIIVACMITRQVRLLVVFVTTIRHSRFCLPVMHFRES